MSDAPPPPRPDPGAAGGPPPLPGAPPAPAPPPLPPEAPLGPDDRAVLHETEDTRTYPCTSCGGQMVFDIASQQLACTSCGTRAAIDTSHLAAPAERDLRATLQQFSAREGVVAQQAGEKEIVCQSCGGHTTFSGSLTATRCPYCTTPIQRDDVHDAPDRLPVDGVVPFRVDEKTGRDAVEKWINGRWFAPSEFKKYKQTGAFSSVYCAYFTYDADTSTHYTGERGRTVTYTTGSGENRQTHTRTDWTPVAGTVANAFDDIAVLANDGLDRKRITELEPWPTASATGFSPEYVAGHLCRTYDNDAGECWSEAQGRMEDVIEAEIKSDIGGDSQRIHSRDTAWRTITFKHLLLPIWLLTVVYEGKPFQVCINGVTGEVSGQRPWSKVKIAAAVVAALVVLILLVVIWSAVGGDSTT